MSQLNQTSVQYIKGIGPKRAQLFSRIGINTVEDLLYYFPRRYQDRTTFTQIFKLEENQIYTIKAKVLVVRSRQTFGHKRFSITQIIIDDGTGRIECVWFNQPYLKDYFKMGDKVIVYGKVDKYGAKLQINSPEFEILEDDADEFLNAGRLIPVYSLIQGFTQRTMRSLIKYTIDHYLSKIIDYLPADVKQRNSLADLIKSLQDIHYPENLELQKQSYRRLAFEEFLFFQIPLILRKFRKKEKIGIEHKKNSSLVEKYLSSLPFKFTDGQLKALSEIIQDMQKPIVMQRLLQGDVGSGKTVVATACCLVAVDGGYQAAFMVPTEILAKQHFEKISAQVLKINSAKKKIQVGLLSAGLKKAQKDLIYKQIQSGQIDIIIGTHALLEEDVKFNNLGISIIDEQHKFGVGQRALLTKKAEKSDCLIMTATPIPRTLAITIYGDMDVSVINSMPAGRGCITTLHLNEMQKAKAYEIARNEMLSGNQVYIVYPVIEESFALDIAGAKKMYEELSKSVFKEFNLGLIHGKLKQQEQDDVMAKFKDKQLHLLVATTVLEVGIDVANATCIIIERAERFGLSQLHQLRGRVGRGVKDSFCVLVTDAKTEESQLRMQAMVKFKSGFDIAEQDLKIRGPGEFFGARQSGLTDLKIGNPLTQMQLLKHARDEAIHIVSADPNLKSKNNQLLKEKLLQRFPEYEKLMLVG